MPRVLGVIAEYNPFHAGHAYHLQQARQAARADYVIAVMSTCFTQRGDAALLSPADRARMALSCGADAVFALPAVWAVRDAEHFALGGAAILSGLGCDAISFGAETADLTRLWSAARLLENPDEAFFADIRQRLRAGVPYPAAAAEAAEAACPGTKALLSAPNSTLAICYLRALLRLRAEMDVIPVTRSASYHDTALSDALPSATALRGAILRGDWRSAGSAMPAAAFRILREAAAAGRLHRPEALDTALLYRLRTMTEEDCSALPDVSEGIEYRLRNAAASAHTRDDLLQSAKTRRYPYARLSRLAAHALLGMTDSQLRSLPLPDAAWLLGFRKDAAPLLTVLSQRSKLPILSRSADFDDERPWVATEMLAHDIWALGAGLPAGLMRSQGLVHIN